MKSLKHMMIGAIACTVVAWTPLSQAQAPDDLATMQTFLEIMDSYFGIIESTYEVSSSAEKAAIMQMQKIREIHEDRGEKAKAAGVLREVLDTSRNPTIRNAAYMLLGDTLKETGRSDEALEVLQQGLRENIKAASR